MNFLKAAEFKVGFLVIAVGSLIAFMSMQVSDDPSYLGRSKKAWFLIPNAGGLVVNSAIKSAGIPVGVIKSIRLQDGFARVDITVKSEVNLTTSAAVEIKAQGILGDKYVEVFPGVAGDNPLSDGGQIIVVRDKGSIDNLIAQVSDITSSLKSVSEALKDSVSEDGTRKHVLGRIVSNIEKITDDLSKVTAENRSKVSDIIDQVRDITSGLSDIANDPSDSGLKKSWQRLASASKNLEEITAKINKGEGTIGKLINDETTVEEINTAVEGISSLIETSNKLQTGLDLKTEYLSSVGSAKTTIGLQIQPGLDRYYYLGIVDDPAGVVEKTKTVSSLNGGAENTERTTVTFSNKTKFTALFAKNFWDLTVRGGLIESTSGLGLDYHFFNRSLRLTLEALDFTNLNLRPSVRYEMFYGFYAIAGMNDLLDKKEARSSYLGAGLFLTNDDLKLLLTKSPF
ncbi:MAG: MlaD family protein [Pseudobdellovibrionaceae bacterium]